MLGRHRVIETYGGAYADAEVVENPEIEQSADLYNRHAEDSAIMSRLVPAWHVRFTLTGDAAPTTIVTESIVVRGPGGNGNDQKPVIAKSAAGTYLLTFPASYTDALDEEVDTTFIGATAQLISATTGKAEVSSLGSTTVGIVVRNSASLAADIAGDVYVALG